ncbi:MAG: hypothetical protein IOC90_12080 [Methylocystis sp.]|nr:hypothetical protein [Methylocystis sp.]MCA3585520.1 hypothetical protein [Methylocystis sp.]MCA3588757.1 hypothetical protein [Methylocystis sp.]MCA3590297.1 hypothetical protein [Methylocystis sp.]
MKVPDLKRLIERAAVVKVDNALNPLLWLTAVVTPVSAVLAAFVANPALATAFLFLAAIPVALVALAYFLFLFRDPDRLQSEEYQLKQQQIELFQKGQETPIIIDDTEGVSKSQAQRVRKRRSIE